MKAVSPESFWPADELAGLLVQDRQAALQGLAEAALLELQGLGDERLGADQLGIGLPHLAHERRHEPPHQRVLGAEKLGVAHGAAHDPAQHVAAALVRGQHAVGDEEGRGAQMVGDDPVRRLLRPVGGDVGQVLDRADERAHHVGGVVVVRALQDGGDALEPHAGVDRRLRQGDALAGPDLLELHEDEVPDLDEAVAVLVGRARRAAGDVLAVVVEDLRARTAGAGVAHLPEIVRGRDADDLRLRQAGDLPPEIERLVVLGKDGDEELVLRQAELLGDQLPGELDRERP